MDQNLAKIIKSEYGFSSAAESESSLGGQMSSARLIKTCNQAYICRKLLNQEQAEIEYFVSEKLRAYNISPIIITTTSGKAFIRQGSDVYNLQEYIENEKYTINSDSFDEIGSLVGKLHSALEDSKLPFEIEDKFDTEALLEEFIERYGLHIFEEIYQDSVLVKCLIQKQKNGPKKIIHADLGIWNLINSEEKYVVIDFGETRTGDPHFDIAAVLVSIFLSFQDMISSDHIRLFIAGYEKSGCTVDLNLLTDNIRLWNLRGILAYGLKLNDREKAKTMAYQVLRQESRIIASVIKL